MGKNGPDYQRQHIENFIVVVGVLCFILLMAIQMRLSYGLSQWQGIVSQFQVLISVFVVVRVGRKGYVSFVILNGIISLMTALRVLSSGDYRAVPGIMVPLTTILIISVLFFYMNQLKNKAKEVLDERARRFAEIVELQEVSIMAMAALAETRDNETGRHIQRTKMYVGVLAEYLSHKERYKERLTLEMINSIIASAPLHDIGKVGIPDSILLKPGKLTKEEFESIKYHTSLGYEAILKAEELMGADETFLKYAGEIVLYHHERWDGTGYLEGLRGEEIPLSARIMSVADVYDALTSERVYKDIHSHEEAIEIISEQSAKQFDPDVVEAFLHCHEEFKEIAQNYKEEEE